MPSLTISNTIQLDFRQGKIFVTDNSAYDPGIANDIVGIIKVTQPDKIVREGDWSSPDIIYSGGSLNVGEVELRLRSDNKPQQGTYIIEYTVDHPDYTPTTLTRTFVLSYEPSELDIEEAFDVFTPNLSVSDATDYSKGGFNSPTIQRLWNAQVGAVTTLAGTASSLDLVYSSNYYDAQYTIGLTVDLTYQHSTYSYLSIVDRLTDTLETSANTPPSYTTLLGYLKAIKQRFDDLQSFAKTIDTRQDFEYASALLAQIKSRICQSDLVGLYDQIQDFLNVYHKHVTVAYVNTNAPIPTYDYSDVDCGGGGTLTDPRITTTMINNWNAAYTAIPSDDLEYIIGVTSGAPTIGASTFSPAANAFVNKRVRLLVNKIPIAQLDWQGNPYYSKPLISNMLTLTGMTWADGDLVQFQFY